jgi:hypothetical protein
MSWGSLLSGVGNTWAQTQSDKRTNKEILNQAILDRQLQKDAMTHGIRWKIADAKAAGINPLFALGAQTSTPSPIHVGSLQAPDMSQTFSRGAGAIGKAMNAAIIDRMRLQNTLLEQEVARGDRDLNNPVVLDGESPANYVIPDISKSVTPGIEGGTGPAQTYRMLEGGGLLKIPAKDVQEAASEELVTQTRYALNEIGGAIISIGMINQPHITKVNFAKKIKKYRPDHVLKEYDLEKTHEIQWDLAKPGWYVRPKSNKFFTQGKGTGGINQNAHSSKKLEYPTDRYKRFWKNLKKNKNIGYLGQ